MPIDEGLIKELLERLDPVTKVTLEMAFQKLSSAEPSEVFSELFHDIDAHRYPALLFTYALVMSDEYRNLDHLTLENLLVTGKRRGLFEKHYKYRFFAILARLDMITESGSLSRIRGSVRDFIRTLAGLSKHVSLNEKELSRFLEIARYVYIRLNQADRALSKEFEEVVKALGVNLNSLVLERYVSFPAEAHIDGKTLRIYALKPGAAAILEDVIPYILKRAGGIPRFFPEEISEKKWKLGRLLLSDAHRLAKLLFLSSFPRRGTERYLGSISKHVVEHLDLKRTRRAVLRYLLELYFEDPWTPPDVSSMDHLRPFATNVLAYLRGANVQDVPEEIKGLGSLTIDESLKDTKLRKLLNGLKTNLEILTGDISEPPRPLFDPQYTLPESVYANRIAIAYASLIGKDLSYPESMDRTLTLYRYLYSGDVKYVLKYEKLRPHGERVRIYLMTLGLKEGMEFRRHAFSPLGAFESIAKSRAYYHAFKELSEEDPNKALKFAKKAFEVFAKPFDPIEKNLREYLVEVISLYSSLTGTSHGWIHEAFRRKRHAFYDYNVRTKYLLAREMLKRRKFLKAYAVLKAIDPEEARRFKRYRDFLIKRYILSRLAGDKEDVEAIKVLWE